MAYQLIWTAEADSDFKSIIFYLKEIWSLQSAEKFVNLVYKRLEKFAAMPTLGRPTTKASVYIFKIDRRNVLFFSVEQVNIILLSIYPYKKDITKSRYY